MRTTLQKIVVLATVVACACLRTADIAHAQTNYLNYSGFTTPTAPVLPTVERHPTLYFDSTQIDVMRARRSDPAYASIWSRVTSNITKYKARTAVSQNQMDRPRMAKFCAFGWVMNGDTVARQRAIEALMIAYDGVPQTATSASFSNSYDEIYRATWLQNYCSAYDWVASSLTPAQNDTIRRRIATETILLTDQMRAGVKYTTRPHNHRSKPAYAIGTAALTLPSHAQASRWLDSALTNLNDVTKYQFSSDGIYREGSHYYIYSIVNEIPFLWHYKNVSGVDLFPYYASSFEWPVLVRDQRGWMPNHEDGYVKPAPTHMVAGAYRTSPTRMHSSAPLAEILQWNWMTTNFFTVEYTGATNDICWEVDEFLLYDASIPSTAPDVSPTQRLKSGQIAFRNSWSVSDSSARYLFFHAVAAGDNHDHPDALQYSMNARNTCMAVDGGYGQDQSTYGTWYTKAVSHNLVMVNGTAPKEFAENQDPPDTHFLQTPGFELAEKSAKTTAANGTARRAIAFVDGMYWIVYDLLASSSVTTTYALNIHGRGTLIRNVNRAEWSIPSDAKYGSAAAFSSYILPASAAFVTKSGRTSLFKDSVVQSYVEASVVKDSASFLHLLWATPSGQSMPMAVDLSTPEAHACEINAVAALFDAAILRKGGGDWSVGSAGSDAAYAWVRREASRLERFAFVEGSYFRWNRVSIVHSDGPMTVACRPVNDSLSVISFDSLASPRTVRLGMGSVKSILFNGVPVTFTTPTAGVVEFMVAGKGDLSVAFDTASGFTDATPVIPASFVVHPVYPNPFNPGTTIPFDVTTRGRVSVRVYSIVGRLVSVLWDGEMAPGSHDVRWDGTSTDGIAAASGVYLFEVRTSAGTRIVKGILVR